VGCFFLFFLGHQEEGKGEGRFDGVLGRGRVSARTFNTLKRRSEGGEGGKKGGIELHSKKGD